MRKGRIGFSRLDGGELGSLDCFVNATGVDGVAWILCRLVTNGTVDESIFRIAKQKLVLDAAVLESGGDKESAAVQNERDVQTMGEILSTLLAASTS